MLYSYYSIALALLLCSGCGVTTFMMPASEQAAYYTHKSASKYCMLSEPVRMDIRARYFTSAKGVWAQINCDML